MSKQAVELRRLEVRGSLRDFFNGMKDPEVILDGPAGTGKTRVILERQHLIQCKYPGARGIMLRRYRSSMNETCMHIFRNEVLKGDSGNGPEGVKWRERDQKWIYPHPDGGYDGGSEIVVAGLDDPQKVMSSMYDWAYGNEMLELTQSMFEDVSSRLRNFVVPYQQWVGDTNPGPPTHWIKRRAESGRLKLLPTFHKDNPVYWNSCYNLNQFNPNMKIEEIAAVMDKNIITARTEIAKKRHVWGWTLKGQQYVNNILRDGLTGLRRRRLYDGEWVAAEGQVYDMFNPEVHVVKRFPIPHGFIRIWVFDFGYIDPLVWQDWAINPETGDMYLVQELYHSMMRVEEACELIATKVSSLPAAIICDHDAGDRATVAKCFGMVTLPAYKDIAVGVQGVQRRLSPHPRLKRPTVFFFDDASIKTDRVLLERRHPVCTREEFDLYVWDTAKMSQDKYKDMPVDKYNHGMDTTRYAIAFIDDLAIDPTDEESMTVLNDDEDMVRISSY